MLYKLQKQLLEENHGDDMMLTRYSLSIKLPPPHQNHHHHRHHYSHHHHIIIMTVISYVKWVKLKCHVCQKWQNWQTTNSIGCRFWQSWQNRCCTVEKNQKYAPFLSLLSFSTDFRLSVANFPSVCTGD